MDLLSLCTAVQALVDFECTDSNSLLNKWKKIGRTGSFVVIDTLLARAETMDTDMDLRKLVEKLRMSRNYMVQTTIQWVVNYNCFVFWIIIVSFFNDFTNRYQFCHRAILDALHKSIQRTVRAIRKKSRYVLLLLANTNIYIYIYIDFLLEVTCFKMLNMIWMSCKPTLPKH